jgi:hypothetical protein
MILNIHPPSDHADPTVCVLAISVQRSCMRAAAASAGKPWNGWRARIRAPMHQRPRPAAADQGSNQASILHCICYSNLPIAIFYSVQFAFDPNPANKTTSVNQHTPRSQGKQHDLCAQSIYNRKLNFLFRCKGPHRTRRRGTMIISRSPPTQGAGSSKGRARVAN